MAELTDKDRAEFLQELDASEKVEVNDFESKFLNSNLGRIKQYGVDGVRFSDNQRRAIDSMIDRYDSKI